MGEREGLGTVAGTVPLCRKPGGPSGASPPRGDHRWFPAVRSRSKDNNCFCLWPRLLQQEEKKGMVRKFVCFFFFFFLSKIARGSTRLSRDFVKKRAYQRLARREGRIGISREERDRSSSSLPPFETFLFPPRGPLFRPISNDRRTKGGKKPGKKLTRVTDNRSQ